MSELLSAAQQKVEDRAKAKTDKLFLAKQLGYDFCADVHAELFAQYMTLDPTKPWALQSPITKRLVLWARGHFKTSSIVVEIVQIVLNFPDIRILIMQGSKMVTENLLHEIASHFLGDKPGSRLTELFPEYCGIKDDTGEWQFGKRVLQQTAQRFTTCARKNKGLAQATVTVASPRSVKTGQHYEVAFFDDLVNDQNYRSERMLTKVKEDFFMCMPLIDPPHYAYVTGTRYAFGDFYEEIMRWNKGEWTVSVKTCWSDDGQEVRFPQRLTADGRMIGFTRAGLLQLQINDPEMFSSQYLLQPIQRGGQRFFKEMLEGGLIMPTDMPPLSPAMLFVDLASTDSMRSDDSVIVCGQTDIQMNQYVVDCRGGKWATPILAQNLMEMVLLHRPQMVWFEKTASCMYFVDYLRLAARDKGIFIPIDFIKIDNQNDAKYMRISSLEGLIKSKRLRFMVGLSQWEKIVEQFGMFPAGRHKHDDYPDTIALMANMFGGQTLAQPLHRTNRNPILAMIEQRERDLAFVTDDPPADDGADGFTAF